MNKMSEEQYRRKYGGSSTSTNARRPPTGQQR